MLPISGCMAATARPKEAAAFIQVCVWGWEASHTQARGLEEDPL